jgi:hypothetical protein
MADCVFVLLPDATLMVASGLDLYRLITEPQVNCFQSAASVRILSKRMQAIRRMTRDQSCRLHELLSLAFDRSFPCSV